MKAQRRQAKILQLIGANATIGYAAIAKKLATPIETIRSDVAAMESEGIIRRSRGRADIVRPDVARHLIESTGVLPKSERRQQLLRLASGSAEKRVGTLAVRFGVSAGTIRADLAELEAAGLIARTHGGVHAAGPSARDAAAPPAEEGDEAGLRNICRRAAGHVEEGDVVFLDGSGMGIRIAEEIPQDRAAAVVTNNLRAATLLAQRGYGGDVFVLPGLLLARELATDMRFHTAVTDRLRITKAFFGAQSYDPQRGLLFDSQVHLDVFRSIADRAEGLYVLLESRKLGESGIYGSPLHERLPKLREIIVDDGLDVDGAGAFFPQDFPVVLCGEDYVLKSPFHRQYTIGFASLYGGYEFSRIVRQSIEKAAKEQSNVELLLMDNRMDPSVTIRNVDAFIERKVDLVIEYQHDYSLGPLIMEKLSNAGIPVIAVDIPIPGAVYFGVNNYRAGLLAGEEAAKSIKERWEGRVDFIIALTTSAAGPIPGNRVVGMLEALLKRIDFPEERVQKVSTANDPEESARAIREVLEGIPRDRRVVILAFNDVVCTGVLETLRLLERSDNAMVASHSHVPSISRELGRAGSPLIGSVAYHPEGYGPRILEIALRMLQRQDVSANNYTEHQWLTT